MMDEQTGPSIIIGIKDGLPTVPLTAWEQAGMVVLFALLMLLIIYALLRWFGGQMRQQREMLTQQQTEWQAYISKLNDSWQTFLHDERLVASGQRREDRERLEHIEAVMERFAMIMADFRADFNIHVTSEDIRMDSMLDEMQKKRVKAAIERKTQPLRKRDDPPQSTPDA